MERNGKKLHPQPSYRLVLALLQRHVHALCEVGSFWLRFSVFRKMAHLRKPASGSAAWWLSSHNKQYPHLVQQS